MKKIMLFSSALLMSLSLSAHAVVVDFTGDYDVTNWTTTLDGGSIDTSNAPNDIVLTSSDLGGGAASSQTFTIAAATAGTVNFFWQFNTQDVDDASFDPFGWLLNGAFTSLSDDLGNDFQYGFETFTVAAGDVFGFSANSTDSQLGVATSKVQNFVFEPVSAVPEPSTYALMLGGLGLVGFMAARRRKQQA